MRQCVCDFGRGDGRPACRACAPAPRIGAGSGGRTAVDLTPGFADREPDTCKAASLQGLIGQPSGNLRTVRAAGPGADHGARSGGGSGGIPVEPHQCPYQRRWHHPAELRLNCSRAGRTLRSGRCAGRRSVPAGRWCCQPMETTKTDETVASGLGGLAAVWHWRPAWPKAPAPAGAARCRRRGLRRARPARPDRAGSQGAGDDEIRRPGPGDRARHGRDDGLSSPSG